MEAALFLAPKSAKLQWRPKKSPQANTARELACSFVKWSPLSLRGLRHIILRAHGGLDYRAHFVSVYSHLEGRHKKAWTLEMAGGFFVVVRVLKTIWLLAAMALVTTFYAVTLACHRLAHWFRGQRYSLRIQGLTT